MLLDNIETVISQTPGLTATQIATAIFGDAGYGQRVSGLCMALSSNGRVERRGIGGPTEPFTYYPTRTETLQKSNKSNATG